MYIKDVFIKIKARQDKRSTILNKMTLSYSPPGGQPRIYSKVLSKNTNKRRFPQNSKIKGFSPLHFYENINKNGSKKESFYQYLFIQYILSNNSSDLAQNNNLDLGMWGFPSGEPNKNKNQNKNQNQNQKGYDKSSLNDFLFLAKAKGSTENNKKTSFILENLTLVPAQNNKPFKERSKKNKTPDFFLHDKIFITYKKSFLCYWLLPFLGLVGAAGPTLLQSSSAFSLNNNNIILRTQLNSKSASFPSGEATALPLLRKGTPFLPYGGAGSAAREGTAFSSLWDKGGSGEMNRTPKAPYAATTQGKVPPFSEPLKSDYSLLLSTSSQSHFKNNKDKKNERQIPGITKKKDQHASQSLLFTAFHFYKSGFLSGVSKPHLLKNSSDFLNLSFADFNFAVLNRNLKSRSNFKWYWFDLLLNKSNKVTTNSSAPPNSEGSKATPFRVGRSGSGEEASSDLLNSFYPNKICSAYEVTAFNFKPNKEYNFRPECFFKPSKDYLAFDKEKEEQNKDFLMMASQNLNETLQNFKNSNKNSSLSLFWGGQTKSETKRFLSEGTPYPPIPSPSSLAKQPPALLPHYILGGKGELGGAKGALINKSIFKNTWDVNQVNSNNFLIGVIKKNNTNAKSSVLASSFSDKTGSPFVSASAKSEGGVPFGSGPFLPYGGAGSCFAPLPPFPPPLYIGKGGKGGSGTESNKTSTGPSKSIKKVSFLMDQLRLSSPDIFNSPLLSSFDSQISADVDKEIPMVGMSFPFPSQYIMGESLPPFPPPLYIGKGGKGGKEGKGWLRGTNKFVNKKTGKNKAYSLKISASDKKREKTILFLFKNKIKKSTFTDRQAFAFSSVKNIKNNKSETKDSVGNNPRVIYATESDTLYNCIFEGLKNSLDLIVDSKANRVLTTNQAKALTLKKMSFISPSEESVPASPINLQILSSSPNSEGREGSKQNTFLKNSSLNLEPFLKNKKDIELKRLRKVSYEVTASNGSNLINPFEVLLKNYAHLPKHNKEKFKRKFSVLTLNDPIKGGNLSLSSLKEASLGDEGLKGPNSLTALKRNNILFYKEKQKTQKLGKSDRLEVFNTTNFNNYDNKEAALNVNKKYSLPIPIREPNKKYRLDNSFKDQSNSNKTQKEAMKFNNNFRSTKTGQNLYNFGADKNSFLFLSKYVGSITNNIKNVLSPYKLRLTYLPEVNKTLLSIKPNKLKCLNSYNKIEKTKLYKSEQKFEKTFLSYLSKSKKRDVPFSASAKPFPPVASLPLSLKGRGTEGGPFSSAFGGKGGQAGRAPFNKKQIYLKLKKTGLTNDLKLKSKVKLKNLKPLKVCVSTLISDQNNITYKKGTKLVKFLPSLSADPFLLLCKYGGTGSGCVARATINGFRSGPNQNQNQNQNQKALLNYNSLRGARSKSALILLKNRLFTNKAVQQAGKDLTQKRQDGSESSSSINRRHNLKIKRRLKKMKCETRRRKKRKIFYPRPTWIVFSMYKKFLDARYPNPSIKTQRQSSPIKIKKSPINFLKKDLISHLNNINELPPLSLPLLPSQLGREGTNQKAVASPFPSQLGREGGKREEKQTYSHWLNNKDYYSQGVRASSDQKKNTKDFYRISNTVFGDLKRVLMKSNWLRSYLNPYLEKVKTIYKEMQKSSQKMHTYSNVRSFILSLYGYGSYYGSPLPLPSLPHYILGREGVASRYAIPPFPIYNGGGKGAEEGTPANQNLLKPSFKEKGYQVGNIRNNKQRSFNREHNINLLEYNRIIYQRIQRVILNIRENLNLNGQIKNRSKKLGKNIRAFIKREYTKRDVNNGIPVNQNAILWSKIVKNNVLKFGRSFISYGYEESSPYNNAAQLLSRNNFYWALNKSATLPDANFNTDKKLLWETYKIREISKSNKTKKIMFNIFMKYNSLFKSTNSLDGYNHILEAFQKSNQSLPPLCRAREGRTSLLKKEAKKINSKPIEDSKFSRFFYKKDVVKDSQLKLNYTGYSLDDQTSKVTFTLPTKTYTVKSEQKLINIENKLKLLGLYSKKTKNKKAYFRFLKNELLKEKSFYSAYSNKTSAELLRKFFNIKQKSFNNINSTNPNLFQSNFSVSANKNQMSNNYSYWWSSFKIGSAYFDEKEDHFKVKTLKNNNFKMNGSTNSIFKEDLTFRLLSPTTLSSFLFHFCALISFISLGGVRTLIKFYYILISKISKLIGGMEGVVRFFPKNNSNIFETNGQLRNKYLMGLSPVQPKSYKNDEQVNTKQNITNKRSKKRFFQIQSLFRFPFFVGPQMVFQNNIIIKNLKLSFLKYLTAQNLLKGNNLEINLDTLSRKTYYELTVKPVIPSASAKPFPPVASLPLPFPPPLYIGKGVRSKGGIEGGEGLGSCAERGKGQGDQENQKGYLRALKKKSQFLVSNISNPSKNNNLASLDKKDKNKSKTISPLKPPSVVSDLDGFRESFKKITRILYLLKEEGKESYNIKTPNLLGDVLAADAVPLPFPPPLYIGKGGKGGTEGGEGLGSFAERGKGQGVSPFPIYNGGRGREGTKARETSLNKNKLKIMYYSFLRLSLVTRLTHKASFYTYLLLLKSVDVLAAPASFIYKFFEKPGEYVVENLAYSFLVEWSADLITTIPDTVDTTQTLYFAKLNRSISSLLLMNMGLNLNTNIASQSLLKFFPHFNASLLTNGFLFGLSNSVLRRLLNSSFLVFIQQLCEPDLDYINRQKKARSIWDIWGEYLKIVAEENSINIYELTTDKEEQVKLLSKYEEALLNNSSSESELNNYSSEKKNYLYFKHSLYSLTPKINKKIKFTQNTSSGDKTFTFSPFKTIFPFKKSIFGPSLSASFPLPSSRPRYALPLSLKGRGKGELESKGGGAGIAELPIYNGVALLPPFPPPLYIGKGGKGEQQHQKRANKANKKGALKNLRQNPLSLSKLGMFLADGTQSGINHNYYGWSVSQFLSYQGKDTDLFIDLHPPKNLSASAASLKYSFSVQQPITQNIGSIVCQIFSGIFYKQISKNILVVGSSGLEKSLLIQAIAGETELKIITDNAHRYAMVYRGVAVGIKLLKDVFEALSVHTPCIFLMEDIHAIGERRPFLIDEASSNSTESTYNKNQSMQALFLKEKSSASREGLYKNNKHLLSHYKKPYKEPRGLATNHFSFTFLFGDLFAKVRNSEIKLSSALSIQVMKKENESAKHKKYKNVKSKLKDQLNSNKKNIYSSSLLIKSSAPGGTEGLAPPASSPFSVLILKEEAKLKHKKTVKEMPWFGLPGEQFSLVSKYNYSIRVKVALLADLVLSNLSVKLDMITDLLVIIDSVKANRGFVVFATTHVPYILDPALRRPGRFDETISLPLIPALYSRWANYRSNVQYLTTSLFTKYSIPFNYSLNKGTTLDLTKYNLISRLPNQEALFPIDKLINYIYINSSSYPSPGGRGTPTLLYPPSVPRPLRERGSEATGGKSLASYGEAETKRQLGRQQFLLRRSSKKSAWKHLIPMLKNSSLITEKKLLPLYSSSVTLSSLINSTSKYSSSLKNFKKIKDIFAFKNIGGPFPPPLYIGKGGKGRGRETTQVRKGSKLRNNSTANKQSLQLKSRNYSYACKSLISLMLYTYSNNASKTTNVVLGKTQFNEIPDKELNNKNLSLKWPNMLKNLNAPLEDYSAYLSLFNPDKLMIKMILMSLIAGKLGESFVVSSNLKRNEHLLNQNGFNFDKTWKYASKLLFSYIQKRQCSALNKNLAFSATKLISFNNKYSLMEAPSPPISNILLPAKRYENYKRTFNNQYSTLTAQNNFSGSVSEKIKLHQQQRLLKRLYKYPIKEFFRSHLLNADEAISNLSNFNNSYLVLGPLEKTNLASVNKLSNVNWCYRNILYNRHKTYLTNQWWNAQQGEHNAETTFLSDIDWRFTFVQSIGDINIDFPDSEQFYNPRNRRWILTSGDWNNWFNIEAELKDIHSHYVYECFTKAYKYLDQNREIIDFYAEFLHQAPLATDLKERNLLNLYKRFFYKV